MPLNVGNLGLGFGGAGDAPNAPTLSISVDGTTVTATIDGDPTITNWLYYAAENDADWTKESRAGDGDIVVAGLQTGVRYTFVAISQSAVNVFSPPSASADVLIQTATTSAQNALLLTEADMYLAAFGEAVTYYPTAGGSRDIIAIVDRNPVAGVPGLPHGNSTKLVLYVKNSADDGISSSEINTRRDKIAVSARIGRTEDPKGIRAILWNDIGMVHLAVA